MALHARRQVLATLPDKDVAHKLVDEIALVGPRERIAERLQAWKASPVRTMLIGTRQVEAMRALAELCL